MKPVLYFRPHPTQMTILSRLLPLFLVAGGFALTGCTRHAYFPEDVRTGPATPLSSPVRAFYDREGNLYPDGSVVVGGERTIGSTRWGGNHTLRSHYRRRPAEWGALTARYLGTSQAFSDNLWETVQDSIRAESIRAIVRRSRPGVPIVVLVNGFNFSEPDSDPSTTDAFDTVRDSLAKWYGARFGDMTFVEVRWDGLSGNGGFIRDAAGSVGIWRFAQANGYFVGMELRRLMTALPHDRPVRIVTHSLGGHVATAALWNVSSKLSGGVLERAIHEGPAANGSHNPWVAYVNGFTDPRYRTPTHPDLRLGMIVPAMPGLTFTGGHNADYYDRNVEGRAPVALDDEGVYRTGPYWPVSTYDRIVVGQNESDRVIKKFIGAAPLYGSTTLGRDPAEFSWQIAPYLNGHPDLNDGVNTVAYRVNLRATLSGEGESEHDWSKYMARINMRVFMDCLFLDVCVGPTVSSE